MRVFGAEQDSSAHSRYGDEESRNQPDASDGLSLSRYRSYGRFYERYWSRLFGVTQADMARFADHIRVSDAAPTLTELAQDVIRARLRQGPQLQSGPASTEGQGPAVHVTAVAPTEVGRWDPTAVWHVGDRVIVPIPAPTWGRSYAPRLGEIFDVHEDRVVVHIDGSRAPQVLALGPNAISDGEATAEDEMRGLVEVSEETAQVDFVLWEYGQYVVGRLLHALAADARFVELEGRWSLRDLTTGPSEADLNRLAVAMFERDAGPLTMSEVMLQVAGGDAPSFSRRLGLALALSERSDLFSNIGTRSFPRWQLAGPPPMSLVAANAVYDPGAYTILCVPGERLSRAVSRRLWDLGLLRAAISPTGNSAQRLPQTAEPGDNQSLSLQTTVSQGAGHRPRAGKAVADGPSDGRAWPKWLRFSRQ